VKSVLIADDEVDRARWWHFTTPWPASRQMSESSADSGGLDGLPSGGNSVGVLEGSDRTRKVEMTRALPGQAGLRLLVLISVFLPWLCLTQGSLEVLSEPQSIRLPSWDPAACCYILIS
jgi:hypothetical protein